MNCDVVIVSYGDAEWLPPLLRSLEAHRGDCDIRVIVVENGSHDAGYPPGVAEAGQVRVLRSANRGFAAANNLGLSHSTAETVFFLNPDTELVRGTLAAALAELEAAPDIGMLAVRQLDPDGALFASIRRFPTAARLFANALGVERVPWLGAVAGERDLRMGRYGRRVDIDWTTGAAMLVRREALRSAGDFDERYFLFSEETDLARRLRAAGWRIVHSPSLEIVHHAGKAGADPRREAQMAYARLQYARRHFSPAHRALHRLVLLAHHGLRLAIPARRAASLWCLQVAAGLSAPPYRPDATVSQRLESPER